MPQESEIISQVTSYRKRCAHSKDWDEQLRCHCAHRWLLYYDGTDDLVPMSDYERAIQGRESAYVSDVVSSNEAKHHDVGIVVDSAYVGKRVYAKKFLGMRAIPVDS